MKNSYDDYDYNIKYALIGDKLVGKTKLKIRFKKNIYSESSLATVGSDIISKKLKIEDKIIRLTIYDTTGGGIYLPLPKNANLACVIFVYSITDKKSFENIGNYLEKFKNYDNKLLFKVLVGNKSDDKGNKFREVKEEEGTKFAQENNMLFFETSAEVNKNVKEIFEQSAHEILKKINKGEYDLNNPSCGIRKGTTIQERSAIGKDKKKCETCCSCYIF